MSTRSPPKEQLFTITTLQKKKTGCEGKATVQRIQSEGDDGNMKRNWWQSPLLSFSSFEISLSGPDQAAITADYLVFKMIYICYKRQDFERRAPRKNLG